MKKLSMFIDGGRQEFYQADLNYSVSQLAHTFNCKIAPIQIHKPLSVEFRLGETVILSGQIDQVASSTGSSSHELTVSGRSVSANMIDSRITMDALYHQDVEKLLQTVAKPFGLRVKSLVGSMPAIPEFQINAESPVENIAQIIREQGYMLIERNGVLTVENTAHETIPNIGIETGNNIESLDITRSFNQEFYTIEVQGAWDDSSATVTSPHVNKSRTNVIICDQLQSAEDCLSRATYEHDLAIAESLTASASIADVFPELAIDGLNRVIRVIDKDQDFSEMLMIKALGLSVTETSASTTIELSRPFKEQSHA
ncbi:tail protein [Vibrio nigripulchritudo]|uniref:tail protein n=1 Tax=Vibrio nigripulchritudo TaxID=28173 RepID=UPI0005FA4BAD|nr:tail protein [Vibrio nigripulchritudo]KJY78951.1 tail protein [Vibrio nigripulchritudo]